MSAGDFNIIKIVWFIVNMGLYYKYLSIVNGRKFNFFDISSQEGTVTFKVLKRHLCYLLCIIFNMYLKD